MSISSKGFTIVELIVVVVVVGIIAAISLIAYSGINQRAIVASIKSDLTNASKSLKLFNVDYGSYPTTIDCGQPDSSTNKCIKSSQSTNLVYQYDNTMNPPSYCLTARKSDTIYKVSESSTLVVGGCLTNNVVANGLSINLDSANTASYSGTGNTWLDLSDNVKNFSLSGPTYNSGNSTISFDGSNDYVDISVPNLTTTATIEMWAKIGASYSGKMFMGWQAYDVYCGSGGIGYNTGNSDLYGINNASVTSLGVVGNWKHYIFEMRSDVSYTNNKIFVNGVQQTLSQVLATENSGTRTFNNGIGRIGMWRGGGSYYLPMELGVFRVYNRSLTPAEVTQNFNALRSRYGV